MTSVMNILFLGTGTSTGVPQIGCSCAVCTSPDPRNRRLRSSVYVEAAGARLLLDSSPDLRQQALREHITDVDAVLYTHAHVDHVGGFDDLRAFCWRRSGGLPMYASPMTVDTLRTMYGWAFVPKPGRSGYVRPEPHEVTAPFRVGNVLATPLPVLHAGVETYAYLLEAEGRSLVYMPDVKSIPEPSLERMKGVDLLIIDGLRYHLRPTHMCLKDNKLTYAPGESGVISAVMKTGNFSGTVDKDMTVHANGSAYKLVIRAQIPDIIRMEPRKLEWARGEAAAPKTIKITISKELPVNLTTVDLTGDAFDYEPVTVKKGREYKIIVTPKSTARPAFNTIWVRTDSAVPRYKRQMGFLAIKEN